MKKQMIKTLFVVLTIALLLLVGCGGKENVTDSNTETGTETIVAELETSTQDNQETSSENEMVAETETQTEESTPVPTEEPTPEPTEEPTPTPEPVHEHSYTETIIVEGTCTTWGTKRYTCSCGYSYEKEYALDHVSDGNRVIARQPDCIVEGASCEHCIYCAISMYGKAIPATGHIPNSYWDYHTNTGNYELRCSICRVITTTTTTRPEGVEIKEYTTGYIDSDTLQPIN